MSRLWNVTTHEYREFVVLHAKSGLPLPSEHRRVRGESCCGGRVMPGCTRDGCATQFYVEPQRYKPTAAAFSFVRGHPNVVCIMFHNSNTVRGLPPVPATDTSRRLTSWHRAIPQVFITTIPPPSSVAGSYLAGARVFQLPRRSAKCTCLCTLVLDGTAAALCPGATRNPPTSRSRVFVLGADGDSALFVGTAAGEVSAWHLSSEKQLDDLATGGAVAAAPRDAPTTTALWCNTAAHKGGLVAFVDATTPWGGAAVATGGHDMLVRSWEASTGSLSSEVVTDGSSISSACFMAVSGACLAFRHCGAPIYAQSLN